MKIAILLNSDEIGQVAEKDVICADGGYRYAEGKNVIAVVGDFDSLKRKPDEVNVIEYPSEKNMTDGELAIRYAAENDIKDIVIYGATGGRLDHILGNISLLKLAHKLGLKAEISSPKFKIYYTDSKKSFSTEIDRTVSIFAYGGEAVVEYAKGLYYPLDNLLLQSFCTRGISNKTISDKVEIKVKSGEIIIFHFDTIQ
ncbi:MAG TPA: thiamine diphosphokinase [Clostridia bacterium]|nr:thiamine diphosphokinase [Clostridia bacterium]